MTVERHGGKRNALWPPQRAPISNRVTGKPAHRIRGVLACLLCFFQCCLTTKATNTIGEPVSTLRSPYCNNETSDLGDSHANDPTVPSCTVETEAGQRRVLSCLLLDYEIGRYDRSGMPVSYLPDTDGWSLCQNFKNEAGVYGRGTICWHFRCWPNGLEPVATLGRVRTYLATRPATRLPSLPFRTDHEGTVKRNLSVSFD